MAVKKLLEMAAEACVATGIISDVLDKIDDIIIKVKTTFANAFLNRCTYIVTYKKFSLMLQIFNIEYKNYEYSNCDCIHNLYDHNNDTDSPSIECSR